MFDAGESRRRCLRMRRRILEVSQGLSALHIAPSFSCLELVDTAYFGLMRHGLRVERPDTFILSKGHGAPAQYAVLEELGVITREEFDLCSRPGGRLGAHPDFGLPGIEASTGSLGHGLGMAAGMALADRTFAEDRTVYLVMSDGELQEGSTWEMIMLAPSLGLERIVALVDLNDSQTLGRTSETHPNFYPILDKLRSFGWEAVEVDGHAPEQIYDAVRGREGGRPLMVFGRTVKGKYVSYMENVSLWHYRSPSPEEYERALRDLDAAEAALPAGGVPRKGSVR
jgi:transketolase